jgi:medium-chain acyl-[acyl-carrier-protein] hydrolase
VVYSDLDLNRHVYSIRYIQWILDSIPLEDFAAKKIRQLDINYLSEAFYDDEIKVLGDHSSDKESHLLIKNPLTKKNIVVAHLLWDTGV